MGHGVGDLQRQRNETHQRMEELARQKEASEQARTRAEEARNKAEREKRNAEEAKKVAIKAKEHAEKQRAEAADAQKRLEKEYRAEKKKSTEEALVTLKQEQKKVAEAESRAAEAVKIAEIERKNAVSVQQRADESLKLSETARKQLESETAKLRQTWSLGIPPEFIPTLAEISAAEKRIQFDPNFLHIAVAGAAGTGKSALINAIRGIDSRHALSARSGARETTLVTTRYEDPETCLPLSRFVWFDVPGAGTDNISDWQYFKDQGLYVFDAILIVIGDRFLSSDTRLLRNCAQCPKPIPTFIIQSKADQHIRNVSDDEGFSLSVARQYYIDLTRTDVTKRLHEAGLPNQPIYIVSRNAVREISTQFRLMVRNHNSGPMQRLYAGMQAMSVSNAMVIDERVLFRDLLAELRRRRYTPETQQAIDKIIYKDPEQGVEDSVESTRASTPLFSEAGKEEEDEGLDSLRSVFDDIADAQGDMSEPENIANTSFSADECDLDTGSSEGVKTPEHSVFSTGTAIYDH
ncbi:interferon-inducible GTPase-domain-containing protein [Peziza echinospora]|nr:interferon-inducible GTPase-domain-containing protein [Peziza echinospora]